MRYIMLIVKCTGLSMKAWGQNHTWPACIKITRVFDNYTKDVKVRPGDGLYPVGEQEGLVHFNETISIKKMLRATLPDSAQLYLLVWTTFLTVSASNSSWKIGLLYNNR